MTRMTSRQAPGRALRIGILGCANIARQFARDVADSPAVRVVAVASRSEDKAREFATTFKLPRHHGSYEALLADAEVDAIYLPLPNSLHAEWAIAAARAGKHVLCEKPLALTHAEAKSMFDAATQHGVVLLESYPYWFQPQTGDLLALLRGGAIGRVQSMQACFGFSLARPEGNIRMNADLGGGALLDAGSYPMSLIRLVMGSAPRRVQADASWTSGGVDRGVDISTMATLIYDDGRRAQLSCAMDMAVYRRASIVGTTGVIETDYLNHTSAPGGSHPWGYQPSRLQLRRSLAPTVPFEDVQSGVGSGFRFAAEAFAKLVQEGDLAAAARAAEASLDIAATLEAIARSARLGQTVDVAVTEA